MALAPLVVSAEAEERRWVLRIDRYEELEPTLASLREAGCTIAEMELAHTDLEEVFVRIMQQPH